MSASVCIACRPMKCGMRRSPCSRLQPVTGTPGPPSTPPTVCAPAVVMRPPSRARASCASVGRVIRGPVRAPMIVSVMPRRSAHPSTWSLNRCRHSATATATLASVCSKIAAPITAKSTASSVVDTLKWLVVPRQAWASMIATSSTNTIAVVQPTTRRMRGQSKRNVKIHASVRL